MELFLSWADWWWGGHSSYCPAVPTRSPAPTAACMQAAQCGGHWVRGGGNWGKPANMHTDTGQEAFHTLHVSQTFLKHYLYCLL